MFALDVTLAHNDFTEIIALLESMFDLIAKGSLEWSSMDSQNVNVESFSQ